MSTEEEIHVYTDIYIDFGRIKLNEPTLCRPYDPIGKEMKIPENEVSVCHDVIWGKASTAEWATYVEFPIEPLTWKDKLRIMIARSIYWLSNLIGEKNV